MGGCSGSKIPHGTDFFTEGNKGNEGAEGFFRRFTQMNADFFTETEGWFCRRNAEDAETGAPDVLTPN
jgi:hypothetical protein